MASGAQQDLVRKLVFGFLAGALAVLVFHQATIFMLGVLKVIPAGNAWSFRPNPWRVPVLVNSMFWGGLWGIAYTFVQNRLPRSRWLGGFVFGVLGPALVGSWLVVALLKGNPVFAGFAPPRLLIGALINGVFGIGVAVFHDLIGRRL
ncbi:MAG TPA: hypothetical protein PK812_06565 [Beijerinckiaceae bacterium]|nr:hypothetical protein [Beijerinckiaceae bacterium]